MNPDPLFNFFPKIFLNTIYTYAKSSRTSPALASKGTLRTRILVDGLAPPALVFLRFMREASASLSLKNRIINSYKTFQIIICKNILCMVNN